MIGAPQPTQSHAQSNARVTARRGLRQPARRPDHLPERHLPNTFAMRRRLQRRSENARWDSFRASAKLRLQKRAERLSAKRVAEPQAHVRAVKRLRADRRP